MNLIERELSQDPTSFDEWQIVRGVPMIWRFPTESIEFDKSRDFDPSWFSEWLYDIGCAGIFGMLTDFLWDKESGRFVAEVCGLRVSSDVSNSMLSGREYVIEELVDGEAFWSFLETYNLLPTLIEEFWS